MKKRLIALAILTALGACDEEPGPTVMTITSATQTISIAANQLRNVEVTQDSVDRYLSFRMTSVPAEAFAEMSTQNVGEIVRIAICGEVVSEPRIMSPITGGTGQISGLSAEDISGLLDVLTGREPCP